MESLAKERADLVHGQWGVFLDRDDLAVWIESGPHSTWNTEVLNSEDKGLYVGHDGLKRNMFVYSLKDLEDIYERMNQLWP